MDGFFNTNLVFEYFPKLLARLHITLLIVILATLVGIILGIALALCRIYKIYLLNQIAIVYISFVRGTPIIVQMFIVYYGLPILLFKIGINVMRWDKLIFVIITYGLSNAAYMSEIVRASIMGVLIGQSEAAYSVGMTKIQTFFRILVPQAVLTAIPSVGTNIIALLHNSAIAFSLGIVDVMGEVQAIGGRTHRTLEGYVGAGIIFLVLSTLLEMGFSVTERKFKLIKSH